MGFTRVTKAEAVRRSSRGAIDAAWVKDLWAISTPVPLTITGFGNTITARFCTQSVFPGWRTQSAPVRMGPSPRFVFADGPNSSALENTWKSALTR
jgi:hypothetical protein